MLVRGQPPHVKLSGIGWQILSLIGQHHNICYDFVLPDQNYFGEGFSNGSGTGVIGSVARGEADIAGVMSITQDRYAILDFSEPVFIDDFKILYKRPVLGPEIAGFIRPFSPLMWILTFCTTVLIFVATWLILWGRGEFTTTQERLVEMTHSRGSRHPHTQPTPPPTSIMKWSADRALLTTLSVLLSQDTGRPHTSSWSVRLVVGMWLLVSLILGTIYRSNLRAMLITPHIELPFDNIEQLIHSNIPLYCAPTNYFDKTTKMAPKNSPLGRLNRQMVYHNNVSRAVSDVLDGVYAGVSNGLFALTIEHLHFSKTGSCGLYMMSEKISESLSYAFPFPKGSQLKPKFDVVIRALKESGIMNWLIKQSAPNASNCYKPISSDSSGVLRSLELGDFYGLFSIYAGGIVMASIAFAVELVLGGQGIQGGVKTPCPASK
ncbi:glutamate receptor isoform X1 [Procambarus clarkii]|uniref:glutamate receptor isoform X1 n=2 Tax=Procambarus clarkii TaxID=6728 RepID=UPI00374323DB